jgi:hypothetical protein
LQLTVSKDPRAANKRSLLDSPDAVSGFTIDGDEFIAGTPTQVAEQIVEQCSSEVPGCFVRFREIDLGIPLTDLGADRPLA